MISGVSRSVFGLALEKYMAHSADFAAR